MAKWYRVIKHNVKESSNFKRFYTSRDMMEIKRMESIVNSEVKRGERKNKHTGISRCSCGSEGCFVLYSK
jgi:hypothetical protein